MDEKNSIAFSTSHLEQNTRYESVGAKKVKRLDSPCSLHIRSFRNRLADSDGISAKAAIDGLVHAGVLQDDSTQFVEKVSYSQKKTKGPEKTEILIY